ncbi:hypothetical protein SOVF_151240 [Spinacia oleracea]|nr:hypothetical protein SOVF_151240 [Spinacia oleracea]
MCFSAADPDAPQEYVYALCPDKTTIALGSRYQHNINTVLSYLSSNSGWVKCFYNTSAGNGRDKVYDLLFCRLDVNDAACKKCVSLGTMAVARYQLVAPGRSQLYGFMIIKNHHISFLSILNVQHKFSTSTTKKICSTQLSLSQLKPNQPRQIKKDPFKADLNLTGY